MELTWSFPPLFGVIIQLFRLRSDPQVIWLINSSCWSHPPLPLMKWNCICFLSGSTSVSQLPVHRGIASDTLTHKHTQTHTHTLIIVFSPEWSFQVRTHSWCWLALAHYLVSVQIALITFLWREAVILVPRLNSTRIRSGVFRCVGNDCSIHVR